MERKNYKLQGVLMDLAISNSIPYQSPALLPEHSFPTLKLSEKAREARFGGKDTRRHTRIKGNPN